MRNIVVKENEAGQRLDKLLAKYMKKAPKSFFYKMLRKKNITLNGKKADGSEHLAVGDEVKLFLSEETIANFSEEMAQAPVPAKKKNVKLDILYEDPHVLLINKPAGMLSQKAKPEDVSLVEYVTNYLCRSGQLTSEDLRSFHPGICNRLDRNTSGLVAAGKSLKGLQEMNELFRERNLHKYYRCIVAGELKEKKCIEGYLWKDERKNQVQILKSPREGALPIKTEYEPLGRVVIEGRPCTYLEVNLLTGRSHQIRSHLASIGHPLLGDTKYGDPKINEALRKKYGLKYQLLHAYRLEFPEDLDAALGGLAGKQFLAPLPELFKRLHVND